MVDDRYTNYYDFKFKNSKTIVSSNRLFVIYILINTYLLKHESQAVQLGDSITTL